MKTTKNPINRNFLKLFIIGFVCLLFATIAWSNQRQSIAKTEETENFMSDKEKARAAFLDAYTVFMSPRCANCHPGSDIPTQFDSMTPHAQGVIRGKDGKGVYGMKCNTCHQPENLQGDHLPPGTANWHMPPEDMKMVFQGRTARQLCEQLKDPKMNGGRKTVKEAIHHLEEDPLVHWAWSGSNGRSKPPLSYEDFMAKMNEWEKNGGACPDK